jgi:pimeloyl-ACP methyl ester carboxylesterase
MTGTAEATVTRALSRDGTAIAYWTTGEGPPLVLAHGSMGDHTAFDPLVAELRDTMTTLAMDRRGFGASGDAAGYALEREFDDVAAVVEAVAARTGGPVALEGHAHLAYRSDPAMVAAVIRDFVSGSAAASGARPGAGTRPG